MATSTSPSASGGHVDGARMAALWEAAQVGVAAGTGELVEEANDEFLRITGRTPTDLVAGLPWLSLTPGDHLPRAAAALEDLDRTASTTVIKDVQRPDGTRVPVLVTVCTVERRARRWVALLIDLSQEERLARLALSEAAIVSTLLEDAPVGFAFLDTELRFVLVNQEMARMNGFPAADHEGRSVFDLLPDVEDTARPLLETVIATGEPLRDVEVVGVTPADPDVTHTWVESFFPIRAPHGQVLGVATLARDETEIRALQAAVRETSERRRTQLDQLQRSFLPSVLADVDGVEIAGTYLPAERDASVGGDWYDASLGADGTLCLCVGDVVGHGLEAVGLMARVSTAIRAHLVEGCRPVELLRRVNAFVRATEPGGLATAVVVFLDRRTGALEIARAGHPYPMLVHVDGRVDVLDAASGPLLGLTDEPALVAGHATLPAGSSLVLYTDGLVERRGETVRTGLARLQGVLGRATSATAPGPLLDTVVAQCLADQDERRDDTCAVAVRRTA